MQYTSAKCREFKCFAVCHLFQRPRVLDDLRVRGHDSWHIGPDLHLAGIECLAYQAGGIVRPPRPRVVVRPSASEAMKPVITGTTSDQAFAASRMAPYVCSVWTWV